MSAMTKTCFRLAVAILAYCGAVAQLRADTEIVDGIEWTFTISGGEVTIGDYWEDTQAVPVSTTGAITIPSSLGDCPVTSIGYYAFYGCSSITSVTIPDSVTNIERCAFSGCSGLTSVTIPRSVTSIGNGAFSRCDALKSVTIPNSVVDFGPDAFASCAQLEEVTFADGLTHIGRRAFAFCSNLVSVVIPDSVKDIGAEAFLLCKGLKEVVAPNSVETIGVHAFSGCTSVTNMVLPFVGNRRSSSSALFDANAYICTNHINRLSDVFSHEAPVAVESDITTIVSSEPSTVSTIDYNGPGVVTETSTTTERNTVRREAQWESNWGAGDCWMSPVAEVTEEVFTWGESGTGSTVSNSSGYSEYIDFAEDAVKCNLTLTTEDIHEYCNRYECGVLMSSNERHFTNIVSATTKAYYRPIALHSVTITDDDELREYAFSNCIGLNSLMIPDKVTRIGDYALYNCRGLTSFVVPSCITNIGENAFAGCSELGDVTIRAWPFSKGFSSVFPDSLKSVTNVVVAEGVTLIPAGLFAGCSGLKSVTIPSTVTRLGDMVFEDCSALKSVTFLGDAPDVGENVFLGTPRSLVVHVPPGSIGWNGDVSTGLPTEWNGRGIAYSDGSGESSSSGGGTSGGGGSQGGGTVVVTNDCRYALTDHAADRSIASVTVDSDCSIDEFVLKDGKVFDSVLYISNVADEAVTLTLPAGNEYKAFKGARPLTIPANSQHIITITRVADRTFLVSREELETLQ